MRTGFIFASSCRNESIYLVAKHLVARRSRVRCERRLSVLGDPGMTDDL